MHRKQPPSAIGVAICTLKLSFTLLLLVILLLRQPANALQLNGSESQVPVAGQASQQNIPSSSTSTPPAPPPPPPPPPPPNLSSGNVELGKLPDELSDLVSSSAESPESPIEQSQEMAPAATAPGSPSENQTPLPPPPAESGPNKLADQQAAQVPENPTAITPEQPVLQQVVVGSAAAQEGPVDQAVASRVAASDQQEAPQVPATQTDAIEETEEEEEQAAKPPKQSVDVTQAAAPTAAEGQNVAVVPVVEPSTGATEVSNQPEAPKVVANQPVVDAAPQQPPQQGADAAAAAPVVEPSSSAPPAPQPVVTNQPESAQPANATPPQDLATASQPVAVGDQVVVAVPVVKPAEVPVVADQKELAQASQAPATVPAVEPSPTPPPPPQPVAEQTAGAPEEPQGPTTVAAVESSPPVEVATDQKEAPIATGSPADAPRESQTPAAVPVVESTPPPPQVTGDRTELPEVREHPESDQSAPATKSEAVQPVQSGAKIEEISLTLLAASGGGAAGAASATSVSQVTGGESLNNTIAHHAGSGATPPELMGEKTLAEKFSENYYVIDPVSCGQLINNGPEVPELVLNMTIERILRTISSQDCGERLAGSMKLRWATNKLIKGQVMEVSSVPLDMGQLMRSSRTRINCICNNNDNNNNSSTETQQQQEPKKVKFILSLEMEPADHKLRSRWRHYPKLRLDDIPLELFGRDNSKSSRSHQKAGSSKCQKFKLESGDFYLELRAMKTLLQIEVTLSKLTERAYAASRNLGGQLVADKYKIKNLSLTHGINLDGPSSKQLTNGGGGGGSGMANLVAPTILIMHDNNNHHRRNSWLYNMYGNWIRHEYRNQLSHLLGRPLASGLNACFLD